MSVIASNYASGAIRGWLGEEIAREQFRLIRDTANFVDFRVVGARGDTPEKTMLYMVCRKVLGKDTENYPQQIGDCFVAGSMVLMADGTEKSIENLWPGDVVLNHLNQPRTVRKVVRKRYTGDLVTIRAKGWHRTLTATATHRSIHLPFSGSRFALTEFAEKPFGDYTTDDYVLINYGKTDPDESAPTSLDLAEILSSCPDLVVTETSIGPVRGNRVHRHIPVHEDLARFVGLYLAEGGTEDSGAITFSFGAHERTLIEETRELLVRLFGLESSELQPKSTVTCVRAASVVVARFLRAICPGNVYSKTVPDLFFNTPAPVRMALLRGWLDGDGHANADLNRLTGVSASSRLMDGITRLALSLRLSIRSLVRKQEAHQRVPALQCDFYGAVLQTIRPDLHTGKPVRDVGLERTPFGLARKLKSVTRTAVEDHEVFCVEVEGEHSLIVNGFAQKNCVSFGAKNAVEYLSCCDILLRGDAEQFRPVFPPYFYGTSRVQIGGGHMGNEDGSLGSWMAAAVMKYGTLFADEKGVPAYSGRVAKDWGREGPPKDFIPVAQKYLVHSAAQINSWDELKQALANGYPCTTASEIGYSMQPGRDGFHAQTDRWGHQMSFIGYGTNPEEYAIILNNWGDVHGHLKDFDDNSDLPVGVLRVRRRDAEKHIRAGETFAYSQFDGFPAQGINDALFRIVG